MKPISLLLYFIEPVVFENYSAKTALRSVTDFVVGSGVRSIGEIIAIAQFLEFEGTHLGPHYRLQKRLSWESRYFLDSSMSIFDINHDTWLFFEYVASVTFFSLVGAGCSTLPNALMLRARRLLGLKAENIVLIMF